MKSSLKNMVVVLFTITAISALLVALVNDVTKDAIAEAEQKNKDLAKLEVLPSFDGQAEMNDTSYQIGDFTVNVTEVKVDGKILGYAVEAPSLTANGYADKIYLMVGFVEDEAGRAKIHGVKVLSQKETPGLGANMIKPGNKLESSILGKYADDLVFKVKKDDASGSFDALTGSTISSRAYANAVETAYAGYLMKKGLLLNKGNVAVEKSAEDDMDVKDYEHVTDDPNAEELNAEEDVNTSDEGVESVESVEAIEAEGADATDEVSVDEASVNEQLDESETQKGEVNNE
ncbi:MAG: RnfABCDGE type electron transport complex subunit G [Rikenellaceae bacterium]|nr:RnfABCDGE type electron transport complex subunit G [Rikenellaceae bacterium]